MSDPQSKVVVLERENQKVLVNVADIAAPKAAPLPTGAEPHDVLRHERRRRTGRPPGRTRRRGSSLPDAGQGRRRGRPHVARVPEHELPGQARRECGRSDRRRALVQRGRRARGARTGRPAHEGRLPTGRLPHRERASPRTSTLPVFTGTLPNGTAAVDKTCGSWTSATRARPWRATRRASGTRRHGHELCRPRPRPAAPVAATYCFRR